MQKTGFPYRLFQKASNLSYIFEMRAYIISAQYTQY